MKVDAFNDITGTVGGDPLNLEYVQGSGNTFIEKPAESAATGQQPAAASSSTDDEDEKKYGFKPTVTEKDNKGNDVTRPMTNTEFGNEWAKHNPEPVKREVKAPELSSKYNLDALINQYTPKPDTEAEKKKLRRLRNLAALTDGINAITNLVGTTQKAKQVYDPSQSMTAHVKAKYDKIAAQQATDRENYRKLMEKGAELEGNENMKKLSLYNTDMAKANSDYEKELALHNTKRNQAVTNYDKDLDNKRQDEHNAETEKLGRDKLNETKRHNQKMEGIASERNSITRQKGTQDKKNTENPMTFSGSAGTVSRAKAPTDTELDGIIAEMQKAGIFGKDSKGRPVDMVGDIGAGLTTRGAAIQAALGSTRGIQIMARHGFKKQ